MSGALSVRTESYMGGGGGWIREGIDREGWGSQNNCIELSKKSTILKYGRKSCWFNERYFLVCRSRKYS